MKSTRFILILFLSLINLTFAGKYDVKVYLEIFPEKVDVTNLQTVQQATVSNHLTEGLFKVGEGNLIVKSLVEKFKWKNNGLQLYIKLKESYFTDGSLLKGHHVITSLKACIKSPQGRTSLALSKVIGFQDYINENKSSLEGLAILNDKEIIINLEFPAPLLIDELAMNTCNIWKGKSPDLLNGAIGTAPYKVELRNAKKIILKLKDRYSDRKNPQTITFFKYHENTDIRNFDLYFGAIEEKASIKHHKYEMSRLVSHHFILNNFMAPFNNIATRKLIADSIDFNQFAQHLNINKKRLQKGMIPYGIPGFESRSEDFISLIELLSKYKKQGFNSNHKLKFTLFIRNTKSGRLEGPLWTKMFKKFPIDINISYVKVNQLFDRKYNKHFQAFRVGKSAGAFDPFRLLSSYHTRSPWNLTLSRTPDCDYLIQESLVIRDSLLRFKKYSDISNCLIKKNQILIPLASYSPLSVFVSKSWKLPRNNRYLLYPYRIYEWELNEK